VTAAQLRSLRGAGVAGVAGAADESVLEVSLAFVLLFVVLDVSVGAVLLSVAFGSVGGVAGMALVSAGVDCGVVAVLDVVELESVDWATATPMPASRAAAAATADNFFW